MMDIEGGQRVTGQLSLKGPIIILTIIFSCISFTLGFFVGRRAPEVGSSAGPNAAEVTRQQPASQQQTQDIAAPPQNASLSSPDRPADSNSPMPTSTLAAAVEVKAPATQAGGGETVEKNDNKTVSKSNEAVQPARAGGDVQAYTVQLGAFKSRKEAERIKAKFSKKGYKIYIISAMTDDNHKIYKVRSGEFRDKKEAEALIARIRKSEDINAFVAPVGQ